MSHCTNTKEHREKTGAASKIRWKTPGYRERTVSNLKKTIGTVEHRKQMVKRTKKIWENPEYRANMENTLEKRKNWQVVNPKGEIIQVGNLRAFSEKNNLNWVMVYRFAKKCFPYKGFLITKIEKSKN